MTDDRSAPLSGRILEDDVELTLTELCQACAVESACVIELVDEGVLEPAGGDPGQWRFTGASLRRVRVATRLQGDLGVNIAGAALVLDLLDELERLRTQVRRLS